MRKIAVKTIMLAMGIATMAGCATTVKNGEYGPSPYKNGKLPGWQKPYTVRGQSYEPLLDHEGFVQEGPASWYGEDFHGKWTSNGEIYDMFAMTAAHKTLPLGVWVKVTNKKNGREAVVRINDRGPFVADRIIDMSYSGAKTLGMVGDGVVPVRVEALGFLDVKPETLAPQAPPTHETKTYGVQIGAFVIQANAERVALELKARGEDAEVRESSANGEKIYRVRVGRFKTLSSAENLRATSYPAGTVVSLE